MAPSEWLDDAGGWDSGERPVAVALVAPKDCGKTAYIAALRHVANRASHVVGGVGFRFHGLYGHGVGEAQATAHLESMYHSMLSGQLGPASSSWCTYRMVAERLERGQRARREVFLLDAMGGHLFPGAGVDALAEGPWRDGIDLRTRLQEAKIGDAEQVLMVFVNEPKPVDGWRLRGEVPCTLSSYLEGTQFDRVVLYVACSDVLFPHQSNLLRKLEQYNGDAASPSALRRYVEHFQGSPHCEFVQALVQYLGDAGLARYDEGDQEPTEFAVFWGSSFGVSRSSGQPNVSTEVGPCRIRDPHDWLPVQVVEPILWSAGMLTRRTPCGGEP